jgi:hypothetical protein
MKKSITTLLTLVTSLSFAASSPVSLVCEWDNHPSPAGDKCVFTMKIPMSGEIAILDPEEVSDYFVDFCYTPPHVNNKFMTTANTGSVLLDSFSYSDPNRGQYIWDNKYLDVNHKMTYGYYQLIKGDYKLAFGQMQLELDIPTKVEFDYTDSRVMNDVASAKVTVPWGQMYTASCHLGYYNE